MSGGEISRIAAEKFCVADPVAVREKIAERNRW